MTSPDKLALASRAEQAGGPDRFLDSDILFACTGEEVHYPNPFTGPYGTGTHSCVQNGEWKTVPAYTASLDAITALIAEKLPGWTAELDFRPSGGSALATIGAPDDHPMEPRVPWVQAKTPALALCAAFLRTLASTEDRT